MKGGIQNRALFVFISSAEDIANYTERRSHGMIEWRPRHHVACSATRRNSMSSEHDGSGPHADEIAHHKQIQA